MASNKCTLSMCVYIMCVVVITSSVKGRDIIGFPIEEPETINPNNNRQPLYIPGRCDQNQLLYPGDQKDDWICDCSPGHLYHPTSDKCFPAYRQGPCGQQQYLILPTSMVIPVCTANPCRDDGVVLHKWKCEPLDAEGSCPPNGLSRSILGVNSTTLVLECISVRLLNRFGDGEEAPINSTVICLPGCKRSVTGKCAPVIPPTL